MLSAYQVDKSTKEPNWQAADITKLKSPQPDTASWLYDVHSLTARLKHHCASFEVRVLSVKKQIPYPSELQFLSLAAKTVCLVREVHLLCAGTPVVFARTCMPLSTLKGKYAPLACLGRKPLGELLFSDPRIQRGKIEVAAFHPTHVIYQRATQSVDKETIWGRRSLFHLPTKQNLLVNEVFLAGIDKITC